MILLFLSFSRAMAPKAVQKATLKDAKNKNADKKAEKKDDQEAPPSMEKGQVSAMLSVLKNGTQTPEALAHYQSLGRFDKEKAIILEKFQKDKSCKWWHTYSKENKLENTVKQSSLSGFGTMFAVADALKMPYDHPLLKSILEELPQDGDWDLNVPMEKIYAKKGLVRYHLEGVAQLTESKEGH